MSLPILYKYTNFENGLKSIQNQKFKWSSIKHFNDPFESRFYIQNNINTIVRLAALTASIQGGFHLPHDVKKLFIAAEKKSNLEFTKVTRFFEKLKIKINEFGEFTQNNYNEIERMIWNETKSSPLLKKLYEATTNFSNLARETIERDFGILCLSESFNNPLMWGHYASDHTGIMFEFDFSIIPENSKLHTSIMKVHYRKEYPEMSFETLLGLNNVIFPKQAEEFMKLLSFTKHDAWDYEQEYRSLALNNALDENNLSSIPKECFKSITIGCSADKENIELALELARNKLPTTKVYHNQLDPRNYKLLRSEL